MAKVIVTGGQGFLGRNLTSRLVGRGTDVCSTYSYTLPDRPSMHNLSHFRLDVTDFNSCLKLINQEQPEIIYHLVAQPLVTSAQRHPFVTLELTLRGAYNLLEAVRQSESKAYVVVYTTDKVYGENENAKEDDRLDTTTNPYETAKTCEDLISRMFARSFGMNVMTVRSANLYGAYDLHWDRIVPYACKEFVHNRNPKLRSNGKLYRDYIYIEDVLDGLDMVTDAFTSGKINSGDAINFGAESPNTPLEILDTLMEVTGKNLPPIILNKAAGEISSQHINYDKAKSLGWYPKTKLKDGLKETYSWYQDWFRDG